MLAESAPSDRLVRFFRALFGWMPGGIAVMVAAVCALFTTFTGGSGVTIIALGGLVYPILRKDGYSEGFSLGLVTASGSLGLLFPPSLPVILYSVVASAGETSVPADPLYLAGLLPGLLLVVLTAVYGIFVGRHVELRAAAVLLEGGGRRRPGRPSGSCCCRCSSSACSPAASRRCVETAAAALAYAVIVECFITRDITFFRDVAGRPAEGRRR